jgi:uncharacterized membrane protein YqjE
VADSNQEIGLLVSFKRLCATVIEIGQVRLELVGTELELEKKRLFEGLLWALAAFLVLGVGLVLLCGFIILLFWEGYRLPVIGMLMLIFLGGAAVLFSQARQRLSNPQGIFSASVNELNKDRQALKPKA